MSSSRNPFEEIEQLIERMSRQFDEATSRWDSDETSRWLPSTLGSMAIDLVEHDDEFVATVDLPGYESDEVDVRMTDQTLRIEADRQESVDEADERYIRKERRHESMHRSIQLPEAVDTSAVTAEMQNGILTVTLPRQEPDSARKIDIE